MDDFLNFFKGFDKTKLINPLTIAYFLIAFIAIVAESKSDHVLIGIMKPLLMPTLVGIYLCSSKRNNLVFILSLLSLGIANMLVVSTALYMVLIGTIFFLVYRILIIYLVIKISKFPGYVPVFIGCMPFLFGYLGVANLTYDKLGDQFPIFLFNGLLLILFGGFCLGTYILKSSRQNSFLLLSTLFFTGTQLIFIINIFYHSYQFLNPLSMILFVSAQYLLFHYIIIEEKRKKRSKSEKKFMGRYDLSTTNR